MAPPDTPRGPRVRLSSQGRKRYRDGPLNPHLGVGIDHGRKSSDPAWVHWVEWPGGHSNEYKKGEIEVIK